MTDPARRITFGGHSPQVDDSAWLAPGATLVGDVTIAAGTGVYFGAVLRADAARIEIGAGSNQQDCVVVHADPGFPARVGSSVSIGHSAVVHGCTIEDDCLIGMHATVLNGAVIGAGSLIAAGTVVLEGAVIPPNSLVAGVPGSVRRALREDERAKVRLNAEHYRQLTEKYRAEL